MALLVMRAVKRCIFVVVVFRSVERVVIIQLALIDYRAPVTTIRMLHTNMCVRLRWVRTEFLS